ESIRTEWQRPCNRSADKRNQEISVHSTKESPDKADEPHPQRDTDRHREQEQIFLSKIIMLLNRERHKGDGVFWRQVAEKEETNV
ncbi:MAG: hypothetical protein Q8P40_13135, partial [Nitrospirota bacterium]|nr:hypothetical protein [Nitrospirota bacterium]